MVFIIHSLDETTKFLSAIPEFLKTQGLTTFEYYILSQQTGNAEEITRQLLETTDQALVVFLGHGASYCIYLPVTPNQPKTPLIDKDNFHVLSNKGFISLSCRSAEFIQQNYSVGSTMLGFDDLPTHWEDVWAQREVDSTAYFGITDNVLEYYRGILVDIFKQSLVDTLLPSQKNFSFFYFRLRLYINKFIARVNLEKISDNPILLANLLFDLKQGIRLFGNDNTLLYDSKDEKEK